MFRRWGVSSAGQQAALLKDAKERESIPEKRKSDRCAYHLLHEDSSRRSCFPQLGTASLMFMKGAKAVVLDGFLVSFLWRDERLKSGRLPLHQRDTRRLTVKMGQGAYRNLQKHAARLQRFLRDGEGRA